MRRKRPKRVGLKRRYDDPSIRTATQPAKLRVRSIALCFWRALIDAINHDGIEHAGYLAFLLMLAIFPFLVFFSLLVSMLGKWYLNSAILVSALTRLIFEGPWSSFIIALKPRIEEISATPPQSFLTLAVVGGVWTASSIFEGLRTVLNRAYRIMIPPSYIFRRVLSIIEFIAIVVIATISVFLLEILPSIIGFLHSIITNETIRKIFAPLVNMIFDTEEMRFTLVLSVSFLVTAYFYYFLPSTKPRFAETFPGAMTTLLCWWVFSRIFKYYITIFPQINLIYGSIAGVVVCLLYFYFCSFIFIFGGELNYHFKKMMSATR